MGDKKKKKSNNLGLSVAIWILLMLVILIVFLAKQEEIKTNLKNTNFFEKLFGKTPTFISEHVDKTPAQSDDEDDELILTINKEDSKSKKKEKKASEKPANQEKVDLNALKSLKTDSKTNDKTKTETIQKNSESVQEDLKITAIKEKIKEEIQQKKESVTAEPPETDSKISQNIQKEEIFQETTQQAPSPKPAEKPADAEKIEKPVKEQPATQELLPQPTPTRKAKLCFVSIVDGQIIRKEITRVVEKTDSPLSTNIRLLLAGPTESEKNGGCSTLIPEGTTLLSARVKDGIAYLDFSEEFEFNTYGGEGLLGEIMQVVFTATEFSTVRQVQFLIEGKTKPFIAEGIPIGKPIARDSF